MVASRFSSEREDATVSDSANESAGSSELPLSSASSVKSLAERSAVSRSR